MKKKTRIALIGLGSFGRKIINPLRYFHIPNEVEIVAVCDTNKGIVKEVAEDIKKDNPNIQWFTNHKKMFEETTIDLAYIATSPSSHKQIVLDAVKKNIHVLCEKPLAHTAQEASEIVAETKISGVINAVHFHLNYSPAVKKFKQLIDENFLGELKGININMYYSQWPPAWQQNSWINTRNEGGFILEQGVHLIQMIIKLFGSIDRVQSEITYKDDRTSETGIIAKMFLKLGTPVLLDGLTEVSAEDTIKITAIGTKGVIVFENWKDLKAGTTGQPIENVDLPHPSTSPWIMRHVIDAIHNKPSEIYGFDVGYEVQKVVDALRSESSDWITIEN
ncbi:Gfo/Idh/MocA family oxidoreductase [Virgibacillus sp. C22-A2]|uniref:Gfo/Idh/MocA family oxidoreductase n=1 Tax=Virgibacillus tibetensis TaxID=3042313 RepID=A0ABU6KEJ9_9BACI|nr:Gfo/Idh/MocA family oxidoreductase [Virgibacillus sp. C22-A2]